jgi:hypothetical protein
MESLEHGLQFLFRVCLEIMLVEIKDLILNSLHQTAQEEP